jgi:uncharacterized membrane protein
MRDRGISARNATLVGKMFPSGSRLELAGIFCLVLLGVALRLRQYVYNRSLWFDEATLALNVIHRDVWTLLSEPLKHVQTAPPGFLVAARSIAVTLGPFDCALRLIPLIAGVAVVLLGVLLARRELTSTVARLTFVGLVALSPVLIFYSSEFKQYSSDVLAAIALLTVFSYRSSPHGTWLLAGTGFVALVCSLPAVFVAAPVGVFLLYEAVKARRYDQVALVGLAWLAGVALHGAYVLQAGVHHDLMMGFWRKFGGFPPYPLKSVSDLLWYPEAFLRFAYMAFKTPHFAGPHSDEALSSPAGFGLAIASAASLALAFSRRRPMGLVAAAAILLTLVASGFEIYPFSTRLVLFLVPLAFLVIAAAIDAIDFKLGWLPASLCALPLFLVMLPVNLAVLAHPETPLATDFKKALRIVVRKSIGGDALAILPWTGRVFEFYRRDRAPKLRTFVLHERKTAASMLEQAEGLLAYAKRKGYSRIWYLETIPRSQGAEQLIEKVKDKTPIVFAWRSGGTRLVVFDLMKGPQIGAP